jgi:hypothetical protein
MKNNWGGYTPLSVPVEVIDAAPKAVSQAWAQVGTAQKRYLQARDELAVMEVDAERAPAADDAAARAAVAAGKPIPAPTAAAALDAVEAKRREVAALMDHADDVEWNFLSVLTDHKSALADGYYQAAVRELAAADASFAAASQAVARFTMLAALWGWSRSDDTRTPPHQGFTVPTSYQQSVDALISECRKALAREHPDAVLQREAEQAAEMAALQGRMTPDGLITDHAAYAAYGM